STLPCQSTSGPGEIAADCIRRAKRRDRPAARRSSGRSSCGRPPGRTRPIPCDGSARRYRLFAGSWSWCGCGQCPRPRPLDDEMRVRVEDYRREAGSIVIANPNAPTGVALPRTEIARLLEDHPDIPVVIDEAYVDFGGESALPLIADHPNLL